MDNFGRNSQNANKGQKAFSNLSLQREGVNTKICEFCRLHFLLFFLKIKRHWKIQVIEIETMNADAMTNLV